MIGSRFTFTAAASSNDSAVSPTSQSGSRSRERRAPQDIWSGGHPFSMKFGRGYRWRKRSSGSICSTEPERVSAVRHRSRPTRRVQSRPRIRRVHRLAGASCLVRGRERWARVPELRGARTRHPLVFSNRGRRSADRIDVVRPRVGASVLSEPIGLLLALILSGQNLGEDPDYPLGKLGVLHHRSRDAFAARRPRRRRQSGTFDPHSVRRAFEARRAHFFRRGSER